MKLKKGIPVNAGVVVGPAFVLEEGVRIGAQQRFIKTRTKEAAQREIERFQRALEAAHKDAEEEQSRLAQEVKGEVADILAAQIAMYEDTSLLDFVKQKIESMFWSPEHALQRYVGTKKKKLLGSENPKFKALVLDMEDMERRLLRRLLGEAGNSLDDLAEPVILVARDLTPSQTSKLPKSKILGFATDHGGKTSHTAIIAQNRGIPAVVGLGNISSDVQGGEMLILDGVEGKVIVDPDATTLARARDRERKFEIFRKELDEERELPCETLDGHVLRLYANIEFPDEIDEAIRDGALGIGLYRTEFLYDKENPDPSEEDHYNAYKDAVSRLEGRPLTIRTLDLGADKFRPEGMDAEKNPFLGCRSIRYCLYERPEVFRRQLRAILRVSAEGNVKIMLPMISSLKELREANDLIQDVMSDLDREAIPFHRDIPVGIMIEVPSAALCADVLAQHAAFFSVGTNDLVQYALAVDRVNENVADLYQPTHPAIFRLLLRVIEAGRRYKIPVSICGELSGEVDFTLPLVGLGLRDLSMAPASIPKIKKLIRSISVKDAARVVDQVLSFQDSEPAKSFLRARAAEIVPELFA
ncbi:MAG TPA: phosphoenolpyruvate--protein phosphotransferase [Planctomycetota bacterium]|nr:phosphoenolpyruvate--protein phosphotransferase [Planctomycetota bacterium]